MITPIPDLTAMAFMALFPEITNDEHWLRLCAWVGKGKTTPMVNLGVHADGKLVGLFPCEAYPDRFMIHACFLPEYRGQLAVDAAKSAFQWVWNHTKYDKILAYIEPEHVKRYAERCGMTRRDDGLYEVAK